MKTGLWITILCLALGASALLQHRIDAQRGAASVVEEALYVNSGASLKKASLGFNGLIADLYWLRTIQYFGSKSMQQTSEAEINNFKGWKLTLLVPLINITTELDKNYVSAYRFGSLFLPDVDPAAAIKLATRAIQDNPTDWRLHQDLGFIFWKQKRYQEASDAYLNGSKIARAPAWMQQMAGVMLAKGGDRETARQIFLRIYESTDDLTVKKTSLNRLQYFQAEDEINFLNNLLQTYRTQKGACPASLAAMMKALPQAALLRIQQGGLQFDERLAPLDPQGFAYIYDAQTCTVSFALDSPVSRWKD